MSAGTPDASLNAARRERELAALADGRVVDLLVAGGGVVGCGVALDAASRGLSVALVERDDLAFGTSRWSSKLVHGGLRYLVRGELGIAHESAVERRILMERTAPHLVRPLPMVLPLYPRDGHLGVAMARVGLAGADLLRLAARTARDTLPHPRRLSRIETLRAVPALQRQGLRGGLLSWDGQLEDDARLVVTMARTAAAHGAAILTRCAVEELHADGAVCLDRLTGSRVVIRARSTVNATGVWAGTLVPGVRLRPSRGTHIVLDERVLGHLDTALFVAVPGERNRFVFALPQPGGRVDVGLTDEPVDGPVPDVPEPPEEEIRFLVDVLSTVLETPLRRDQVAGAYAGLRPLLEGGDRRTADLSRRHAVLVSDEGIVTIVGGKLTTYRRMAEDAVDAAVRRRRLEARPCRTRDLPLVGAAPVADLAAVRAPRRLVDRHGTEAASLVDEAGGDAALLRPLAPGLDVCAAELLFALRHEGALDAADLLDRRTRVGLVPADRARALPLVEALLADAVAAPPPGPGGRTRASRL